MTRKLQHAYSVDLRWTGNRGRGTAGYADYAREYEVSATGKPAITGSADPAFRGDALHYNPEEMLVASLSACHMLWYLHLCSDAGVVVTAYTDEASGTMTQTADGGGHFTEVILHPSVTIKPGSDPDKAVRLHQDAHRLCFVANSVNFPVRCEPAVSTDE